MRTLMLFLVGLAIVFLGGAMVSTDRRLKGKLRLAGFAFLVCAALIWLKR